MTDGAGAESSASVWHNPAFRRFWSAHTATQFGTQISFLALPLLAIEQFGAGPLEVAALGALEFLPYLLIGLPAGVWVDRWRRRPVMIATDLGRAGALLSIPVAWAAGVLTMPQLFVVAAITGLLSVFFDVAAQSHLPSVIARDRLVDGNAKLETSNAAARIAGPSVAGSLIQVMGAASAIGVDAVSYLVSAVLLRGIRQPETSIRQTTSKVPRFRAELFDGLRFVVADRRLLAIAASSGFGNLAAGVFDAVYLLYLVEGLDLAPTTIGIIYGAGNAGLLIAAFFSVRLAQRVDRRWLLVGSAAARSLGFAVAPLAALGMTPLLLTFGRTLVAGSVMIYNVQQVSLRQTITPGPMLGRVNATIRAVSWGTIPFGMIGGGIIASAIGLLPTLWIGACLSAVALLPLLASTSLGKPAAPLEDGPDGAALLPCVVRGRRNTD